MRLKQVFMLIATVLGFITLIAPQPNQDWTLAFGPWFRMAFTIGLTVASALVFIDIAADHARMHGLLGDTGERTTTMDRKSSIFMLAGLGITLCAYASWALKIAFGIQGDVWLCILGIMAMGALYCIVVFATSDGADKASGEATAPAEEPRIPRHAAM